MKTIENELIPVYENERGNRLVNGRELHGFLKVQQDFSDWIKKQLELIDAKENKEFSTLKGKTSEQGGRPSIEYVLTIGIAKEISMVAGIAPRANEETKKLSKQAREYFVKVEEKYKQSKIDSLEKLKMEQLQLEFTIDRLKVSKASEVKMIKEFNISQGLSIAYLPEYVDEDAGLAPTTLLEKFNVPMSVREFNKLMVEHGFLEERTRPSTNKSGIKKYKSLTDKGLKYGKNERSTRGSAQETQPLYYEDTFMELINFLNSLKGVM